VLHRYHRPISQAFGLGSTLSGDDGFSRDLQPINTRCLPAPLNGMPDRRSIQLPPGSVVLLATDGLWCFEQPMNFLERIDDSFRRNLVGMENFADVLVSEHKRFVEKGCMSDNTTFVLFHRE
jgi:serine/threonine protein phosphatase PrpC